MHLAEQETTPIPPTKTMSTADKPHGGAGSNDPTGICKITLQYIGA